MRPQIIAYLLVLAVAGYSLYEVREAGRETDQTVAQICDTLEEQLYVFLRFVGAHAYTRGKLDPAVKASAQREIAKIRPPAVCGD